MSLNCRSITALVCSAIASACSCAQTPSNTPTPVLTHASLTWSSAPPMLHARAAHAVVATADAIYALAGTGAVSGAPVLSVERFDGTTWSEEALLPGNGLNAPAAVALDGKIYLIGGFGTTTNVPTGQVRTYDTSTRRWSTAASLPSARGGHGAAVLDGLIHVAGGGNSQRTLADHSVFDPAANRWMARAPLPRAEGSPALAVAAGKLYAIGGRSGTSDFGDVLCYDAATDSWAACPSIKPRATCGAVSYRGSLFVFGGESQLETRVLADVLTLANDGLWRAGPPMPTARSFARAVIFRDTVYVVGGSFEPQTNHAPRGTAVVERLN